MKLYTFDEVLDMQIGKKGTPERDKYDDKMEAFLVGEAIFTEDVLKRSFIRKT